MEAFESAHGMTFAVLSNLYQAGRGDDGQPVIGEYFYVAGERADGSRVEHQARFSSLRSATCEETGEAYFVSRRADMEARAERLCAAIQAEAAAGELLLNPNYWTEARPCYGSAAYVAGDWAAIDAAEERAAG